jgi:hypothetical protein
VERRHVKRLAGMLVVLTLGVLVVAAIAQYGLKM